MQPQALQSAHPLGSSMQQTMNISQDVNAPYLSAPGGNFVPNQVYRLQFQNPSHYYVSNESSANKQISQYPPMSMGLNQFGHQVQNIQTLPLYSGVPAMATQNVQQSHIAGHSNYTYLIR